MMVASDEPPPTLLARPQNVSASGNGNPPMAFPIASMVTSFACDITRSGNEPGSNSGNVSRGAR